MDRFLKRIFMFLIIFIVILVILLFVYKNTRTKDIKISLDDKITQTEKIDISKLDTKKIKEYKLIINNKKKETLDYRISFKLKHPENYIIKLFKENSKQDLLEGNLSIDNSEFTTDGQNSAKYIIMIRKITNNVTDNELEVTVEK